MKKEPDDYREVFDGFSFPVKEYRPVDTSKINLIDGRGKVLFAGVKDIHAINLNLGTALINQDDIIKIISLKTGLRLFGSGRFRTDYDKKDRNLGTIRGYTIEENTPFDDYSLFTLCLYPYSVDSRTEITFKVFENRVEFIKIVTI
ncbi:MAG: hypothetical protein LBN00_04195 [Oscillospiraceae bacterium]|jgi:hypothetical protein|nr:hypothetical protein [Oscillospiraceae bacterium]